MHTETIESVRVEVEPTHLIKGLRQAFTGKLNVVAELLSNARRASASRVTITVTDRVFTIEDDGIGVQNFHDLIKIGGTAWDSFIQADELPYGCGFLSALFGAEHIRIESSGCVLDAETATLLAQEAVDILHDASIMHGTRITLTVHQLVMGHDEWENLCTGYPIPVIVNGIELARKYAIDHISSIDTPIGRLHINPERGIEEMPRLFLQGFAIGRVRFHSTTEGILHLDARTFLGRFPDRAQLCEENEAYERITQQIRVLQTAFLSEKKAALNPEIFVEKYAEICIQNGDAAMLNDIRLIPTCWVSTLTPGDLVQFQDSDRLGSIFDQSKVVDLGRLASGFCLDSIIPHDDYDYDGSFVPAAFAVAKGFPFVSFSWFNRLDFHHPLRSMLPDLSETSIIIRGEVGRAVVDLDEDYVVVACNSFVLRHDSLGEVEISDFAVYAGGDNEDRDDEGKGGYSHQLGRLISPVGDSDVILQTTRCLVDGYYDETTEEDYRSNYNNAYAEASAMSLVDQLQLRITQQLYNLPQQFFDSRFLLSVQANGVMKISEANPN